ncbi:MAG: hypothetical protein NTW25_02250 [Candidatus Kapabacteria bacterium]|nr:hypothetical protein [Candidatus Kapabacteria bacterium]
MEKIKNIVIVIVLILISLFALFIMKSSNSKSTTIYLKGKTDTVVKLKHDTITLQGRGIIEYRDKTIYVEINGKKTEVTPFEAKLDTLINQDSINIKYNYPVNVFDLTYKRHDSIITINKTDTLKTVNTEYVKDNTKWYENLIYGVGGFVIGLVVK